MILPAVKFGLVLWGLCCNSNPFKSIERLHSRAAPINLQFTKGYGFGGRAEIMFSGLPLYLL